jgi:hypothetical protein
LLDEYPWFPRVVTPQNASTTKIVNLSRLPR